MSRSQVNRPARLTGGSAHDGDCPILHVDMDAFYASVELLDRPYLRQRPVIVAGASGRAVVLSATYEAREFGVYSGMPVARARRLCPDATVVPPDHRRYTRASAGIMSIFRSITDKVEPLALDEAFLDVSSAVRRLGRPTQIAELIRARIADEQGLTASVGVASTKFVAKLASTRAKPDGLLVVPAAEVISFLHPMPVGALWGVGERTEEQLQRLGLRTVGQIARTPPQTLQRALGDSLGRHLFELSWGRDDRHVVPDEPERSVGAEETFPIDVDDHEVLAAELLRLSERVAARLRAAGYMGRTVVLKVRFADFTTITRSKTLEQPVDVAQQIYTTARNLLAGLGLQRARVRLIGVRVEKVVSREQTPEQLMLTSGPRWRDAEEVMDRAAGKYGRDTVKPARLVRPRPWDRPD